MIVSELTIRVSRKELRELNKFFGVRGRKGIFCNTTGIAKNTLWLFLKTGEATTRVVTTIISYVENYNKEANGAAMESAQTVKG